MFRGDGKMTENKYMIVAQGGLFSGLFVLLVSFLGSWIVQQGVLPAANIVNALATPGIIVGWLVSLFFAGFTLYLYGNTLRN